MRRRHLFRSRSVWRQQRSSRGLAGTCLSGSVWQLHLQQAGQPQRLVLLRRWTGLSMAKRQPRNAVRQERSCLRRISDILDCFFVIRSACMGIIYCG